MKNFFCVLFGIALCPLFSYSQCTLTGSTTIPSGTYDVSSSPTYFPAGTAGGSLVIATGSTVNITNTSHIQNQFQNGATITVQAGAALYLDGVNFTSCSTSNYWQGIQVLGTQSALQTTGGISALNLAQQGLLVINDYSLISNAQIGVEVGSSTNNAFDGGIIRLSQVTFTDCFSAVTFDPFSNPNWSYLYGCTFTWDKIINTSTDDFNGMALVTLNKVQGVFFAGGNIFSNTTPYSSIPVYLSYSGVINPKTGGAYEQNTDRGQGIFADNSSFFMKSSGTCFEKDNPSNCIFCLGNSNTFQYLSVGIQTHSFDYENLTSASEGEIMISGCYFNDCEFGVVLNYVPEIFINRNKFIMDDNMDTYFHYADMQGITITNNSYLSGFGYYSPSSLPEKMEISDNLFYFLTTYDPGGCNPGVCYRKEAYVNAITCAATLATGGQELIYHNTFTMKYAGLACATYMNGIELLGDNTELQIQCNTFNLDASGSISCCASYGVPYGETCADIFINLDYFGKLQTPQATGNGDAGNLFSQNCGNPTACGLPPNGSAVLYNFMFAGDFNLTSHVTTYNGGTLNYYYNASTARKNPAFNYDPSSFLSVNTATTSNSCTESSYCQFFTNASFSEDEYTAMTGVHDPTQPNDDIEMAMEDWEGGTIGPPMPPNPGGNGHSANNLNSASDSVSVRYYTGLNSFTYNVNNTYYSGQLVVSDMMGRIIKSSFICGQAGTVSVQLPVNNSYVYSIIIDGHRVKTGVFFVSAQ